MKKVLVLCTGNSCRSILAEALINSELGAGEVEAASAGVRPKGVVNPLALEALRRQGLSSRGYSSKAIAQAGPGPWDLVVTVCDSAKESCPVFPGGAKVIHLGFEDPDGKALAAFESCLEEIRAQLLPRLRMELGL